MVQNDNTDEASEVRNQFLQHVQNALDELEKATEATSRGHVHPDETYAVITVRKILTDVTRVVDKRQTVKSGLPESIDKILDFHDEVFGDAE